MRQQRSTEPDRVVPDVGVQFCDTEVCSSDSELGDVMETDLNS